MNKKKKKKERNYGR